MWKLLNFDLFINLIIKYIEIINCVIKINFNTLLFFLNKLIDNLIFYLEIEPKIFDWKPSVLY